MNAHPATVAGSRCWGLIGLLAAASISLLPVTASGQEFPASGEAIVRGMHDRFATSWYRTLTFTEKATRRTPQDSMVTETWREALMIPGRLRIDVEHVSPPRTYIYAGDSLFVVHGDSVTRLARRNLLLTLGFDVYRQSVEKTVADLHAEQMPMGPVHADTWEGREVYVVGARAGDLHSPQFWIDRDRLLFVRALEPNERDSSKTDDYRFDNYELRPGGGWVATTVIVTTDGKVTLKEQYSNVELDRRLDAKMFRPPT